MQTPDSTTPPQKPPFVRDDLAYILPMLTFLLFTWVGGAFPDYYTHTYVAKTVVVSVAERPRQYTEVSPGFSTGEGFRILAEYGHTNLWGNAVQLTLHCPGHGIAAAATIKSQEKRK